MSAGRRGFEPRDNEGVVGMLTGVGDLAIWLLIIALILGGASFIYLGIAGIENSLTLAAGAATGSAMFAGALVLIVWRGFRKLHQTQNELFLQQEKHLKLEEQQTAYLKYLAEQARKQVKVEGL